MGETYHRHQEALMELDVLHEAKLSSTIASMQSSFDERLQSDAQVAREAATIEVEGARAALLEAQQQAAARQASVDAMAAEAQAGAAERDELKRAHGALAAQVRALEAEIERLRASSKAHRSTQADSAQVGIAAEAEVQHHAEAQGEPEAEAEEGDELAVSDLIDAYGLGEAHAAAPPSSPSPPSEVPLPETVPLEPAPPPPTTARAMPARPRKQVLQEEVAVAAVTMTTMMVPVAASAAAQDGDEEHEGAEASPVDVVGAAATELLSEEVAHALMARAQRHLLEIVELTEVERRSLLGDADRSVASTERSAPLAPLSRPSTAGRAVAGSGSRIAWLLREGIGSSAVMGIHGAVRPATKALDHTQLRRVTRSLFAQQRALASQSAIGNWELLGALALLQPKLARLRAVHTTLLAQAEDADLTPDRQAAIAKTVPRIVELIARREQQQRWCTQVWSLRREAVGAVSTRLTNQALYALTKLTDAANSQPASAGLPTAVLGGAALGGAPLPPTSPRAGSAYRRHRKRDALSAALFNSPPVLPFVLPADAMSVPSMSMPSAEWSTTTDARFGTAALLNTPLPHGLSGLSTAQMQRLVVASSHWPRDFATLGPRMQRQLLAECMQYCLTGEMHAGLNKALASVQASGNERQADDPSTVSRPRLSPAHTHLLSARPLTAPSAPMDDTAADGATFITQSPPDSVQQLVDQKQQPMTELAVHAHALHARPHTSRH